MILALAAIAAFPKMFLRWPSLGIQENILEICGMVLILMGQLLRVSARGYKSEHSLEGQALIQTGPYTLVRNPMYLGILLIGMGVVLTLFKWWVIAIFLLVFILRYLFLAFQEEKILFTRFQGVYRDYCRRVPRFIPLLVMVTKADIRTYLPLKLVWFKKELGSILALLIVTLLLKSWVYLNSQGINASLQEALLMLVVIISFLILVLYFYKKTQKIF